MELGVRFQQIVGVLANFSPNNVAVDFAASTPVPSKSKSKKAFKPARAKTGLAAYSRECLQALRDVWATLLLFIFAIGGLYGGLFTPTEAGGMGAGATTGAACCRRVTRR